MVGTRKTLLLGQTIATSILLLYPYHVIDEKIAYTFSLQLLLFFYLKWCLLFLLFVDTFFFRSAVC
jgi:hypothetical protein